MRIGSAPLRAVVHRVVGQYLDCGLLHRDLKPENIMLGEYGEVHLMDCVPLTERNPRRPVPVFLAELCRRSMALDKAEDAAESVVKDFKPWQQVREKEPLIEARGRVETLKTDLALAFAETVKLLEAAVVVEEDNATARAALAELWRGRQSDAERAGDKAYIAYALAMIRRYDDGNLTRVIDGGGTITLASTPPGAEVTLHSFVTREGILVPEGARQRGRTPIGPVDGRRCPWGDLVDSSLAKCRDSRDEDAQPEPVGAFGTAQSVYGMGDASGNMWDWTDTCYDGRRLLRVLRGGSWESVPSNLRCGIRYWSVPQARCTFVTFRCAKDL